MKIWQVFLLVVMLIVLGCSETVEEIVPPTQVTINDSNEDGVWHVPSDSILGNVDVWFLPNTMQGSAIWLINGPGRAVGFDVTNASDRSTVYFGDGYTGAGKFKAETGTTIPVQRWVYVRVVVYRTFSGAIAAFLDALGAGFFDELQDVWIEAIYEAEVYLDYGPDQAGAVRVNGLHEVTQSYRDKLCLEE